MRGFLTSTERTYFTSLIITTLLCLLLVPVYVVYDISQTIGNLALKVT